MTFYQKSAQTALRLITKFGQTLKLQRIDKTPDAVSGANNLVATVNQNVKAVILPISTTARSAVSESDNKFFEALVTGKLRYLLIAAAGTLAEPAPNDVSYFDGAWWQVIGTTSLSPAGTPIVYKTAVIKIAVSSADANAIDLLSLEEAASLFHILVNADLPDAFPGA